MTAAEQHIIDVVELAIDWNLDIPEGYIEKYKEITGGQDGRQQILSEEQRKV
jgi:hypothetical protein